MLEKTFKSGGFPAILGVWSNWDFFIDKSGKFGNYYKKGVNWEFFYNFGLGLGLFALEWGPLYGLFYIAENPLN